MKLWKVRIKTYFFGVIHYELFVLADTEENMLQTVYKHPRYHKDEDAEIEQYEEIELKGKNRVL